MIWNDNYIFAKLKTLNRQTLKVYEEQNSLNDQAVAVNSSICELLTSFPFSQTSDQNRNTIEYLDFSSESESNSGDLLNDNQEPQDLSSLLHIQHGVELNNETTIKFTTQRKGNLVSWKTALHIQSIVFIIIHFNGIV